MSTIEMKLNAVMRAMTAKDPKDYESAMAEICMFLEQGGSSEVSVTAPDIRDDISNILLELGVPSHLKGYPYLVTAIGAAAKDPELLRAFVKGLYPVVAKVHNTTYPRTERAIRYAIEAGWDRVDQETMIKYFGNSISCLKGKPTNSEYIARIAEIVRRRMKEA